jgi:hypothetical protein
VGGGHASSVRKWIFTDHANEVEGDAELLETINESGYRVGLYRFPEYPAGGVNGSHLAAVIEIGDEIVFASLHGDRYLDVGIALAVNPADQLEAARR